MDIKCSFSTIPFSQQTQMAILRKIGLLKNDSGVLRGQINDIISTGNRGALVIGDYPDPVLKKIVSFKVPLEQTDVNVLLKGQTLLIQKPVGVRQYVWNIDVCTLLTSEFGIVAHPSDFIPKRLDPSANVIELEYVPYHPFFYGVIKIMLSEDAPMVNTYSETNGLETNPTIVLKPRASNKVLFDTLSQGDYISSELAGLLLRLSDGKLTNVNGRAKNNLYAATVARDIAGNLEICLNEHYQLGNSSRICVVF